ncbi:iron complex transport system permease protein [Melghirimyces profundicolus]|uniref:Iron complex transport system permease protein n=1 Tax=Melghirimyces profundicolus TaxID=1242148 RepID=A0A2T6BXE9_9BACL|nr:iron ABC transporter permease [Melghirimyces profundicolus]PTX60761.1 iron complex transport system permease protein [Melghirimyces profundicolus]
MNQKITFRIPSLGLSFMMEAGTLLWITILALACGAVFVISIGIGEMNIAPPDVLKALFGQGNPADEMVITTLRLPRVLAALLVGVALAVAGAILQGVVRNPLASPDIIGITGGASVTAVAFITLFHDAGARWLPVAAFAGGAMAALLIYTLAWKKGVSPFRLILIGIGVNAAAAGLTTLLLIISPIYTTSQAVVWLTGSVYASSWSTVWATLIPIAVFLPLSLLFSRHLNAQELGDALATGLGSRVQLHRLLLVLFSVALASTAVAAAGPIGFVGLMAPHIARMLTGPSQGQLLPVAALTGALLVMVADLTARTAFSPLDLPAGLFTAVLGAPFLIALIYRSGRTV